MLSAASCNPAAAARSRANGSRRIIAGAGSNLARGRLGMSMDSTRADMTQAVLEGVAFAIRDSFEVAKDLGIKIEETKICGGGAKSPLWRKIIANVLNIKVNIIESEEGPGLGGAMLAAKWIKNPNKFPDLPFKPIQGTRQM